MTSRTGVCPTENTDFGFIINDTNTKYKNMTPRTGVCPTENIDFGFITNDTNTKHKLQRTFCALSQIVWLSKFHIIRSWQLRINPSRGYY